MNVRLKIFNRYQNVSVRDNQCPKRRCFFAAPVIIRSAAGASGCSSQTTDWYACGTRENHGCPTNDAILGKPPWKRKGKIWHEATQEAI